MVTFGKTETSGTSGTKVRCPPSDIPAAPSGKW